MTIDFPKLAKQEVQQGLNKIASYGVSVEKKNGIDWVNSTKQYYDTLNPKYVSWEFYKSYTQLEPPFGQLGLPVFLRTYSRFIPFLNRREKWCETILRVVEYSLSLDDVSTKFELTVEAEVLFDDLFNLRCLSAGRTMWVANTKIVEKDASANYNCSAATIDSFSTIAEGFYLLLVGSGFGFSVESKYVDKLYRLYKNKKILHKHYNGWIKGVDTSLLKSYGENKSNELELNFNTVIEFSDYKFIDFLCKNINFSEVRNLEIVVGDSKEGWVTALKTYLLLQSIEEVAEITFNYDYVRPEGTPLKTFGGRSSGHFALQTMFQTIEKVINESGENGAFLKPIQVMDILNCIGLAVVVGGVRRSSQLVLANYDDESIKNAKKDLWIDPKLVEKRTTRVMSNNSLALYENPGLDWFKDVIESVRTTGEPGFISVGNANKKDLTGTRKVFNPCSEILLDSKQTCNLTEVFLPKHITNGKPNYKTLEKSLRLATRMGSRITLVTMFHSEWDKVQKRDRLLGVSLSGIVDFFDAVGFNEIQEEEFYQMCRDIVHDEANKYHDKLGINRSLLKTTVKPSGTLSSLVGCGAGIHRLYAPYHYRRVRVSVNDPICKVLYDLGIPCKPENGQGEYRFENDELVSLDEPGLYGVDASGKTVNTWVFTFVVKNNTNIKAIDESAIAQLERYKRAQNNYVDHNVSFTCSVDENEWNDVATWLYENYDSFIGVSFLPKFDSTNAPYPQLPYETIDKETYESFSQSMPTLTEHQMLELLTTYEKHEEEYELEAGCETGFCPSR